MLSSVSAADESRTLALYFPIQYGRDSICAEALEHDSITITLLRMEC